MAHEAPSYSLVPQWAQTLQSASVGLSLAREKNWLLVWDKSHWIYLLSHEGRIQGQARFPSTIADACVADDGSALVIVGKDGMIRCLAPDLTARWDKKIDGTPLAAVLDPSGQILAVSDAKGSVIFFGPGGESLATVSSPRPLRFLAMVSNVTRVAAAADLGLVGAFDIAGEWIWKDWVLVNVGGLSVSGDGGLLLVACFSDGLHRYGPEGQRQSRLATPEPCRQVAQSYGGDRIVVGGMDVGLAVLNQDGVVLARGRAERPIGALAMAPFGDAIYGALAGGGIVKWKVSKA